MASIIKCDKLLLPNGSTPTAADLGIDVTSGDMPAGSILQVQATSVKSTASGSSTSATGVNLGLLVSITPKKSNSAFFINVDVGVGSCTIGNTWAGILLRDGNIIGGGYSDSGHSSVLFKAPDHTGNSGSDANHGVGASGSYLDTSGSTAGVPITFQCNFNAEGGAVHINEVESLYSNGTNPPVNGRTSSTITVFEIAQ